MNKHKKNRQAFAAEQQVVADYASEPRAAERSEHAAKYPIGGPPVAQPRGLNPFVGRKAR